MLPENDRAPRLIIDITPWPSPTNALDALFASLRDDVLRDSPLRPALLILTQKQYERLPRSYDSMTDAGDLQIRKVGSAEEARALVMACAGEPLVMSPWRFDPIERWLAAEFDGKSLKLDPEDGLREFADDGALEGIATVVYPLAAIATGDRSAPPIQLPATALRTCLVAFAVEEHTISLFEHNKSFADPDKRLTFAWQIGATEVTSLLAERREHEIAALAAEISASLGVEVATLDDSAHAFALARATKRPRPPAAWRNGDTLHLLHADPPREHPSIVVHRPSPPVPALTRLLRALQPWTAHDYELDPVLAKLVDALATDEADRLALLHARATLLWNSTLPPVRPNVAREDWLAPLRRLLEQDPPAAALRVAGNISRLIKDGYGRDSPVEVATIAGNDSPRGSAVDGPSWMLRTPPPCAARFVHRNDGPIHLRVSRKRSHWINVREDGRAWRNVNVGWDTRIATYGGNDDHSIASLAQLDLWLPDLRGIGDAAGLWLDAFERSSVVSGWRWDNSEKSVEMLRTLSNKRFQITSADLIGEADLTTSSDLWREADLLLGQCWLALRGALRKPETVRLPSGALCVIGGGVTAYIEACSLRDTTAAPVAAFHARVEGDERSTARQLAIEYEPLWTHITKVDNYQGTTGIRAPSCLWLSGEGCLFRISFVASSLLASPGWTRDAFLTVVAKAEDDWANQDDDYDQD